MGAEPEGAFDRAAGDAQREEFNGYLAEIVRKSTPESGDRKQDRSKKREQEILRAALRVFARDGISRARIGDIALEAGMPVSSIYEYFPSKEDLAYAVPTSHLAKFYVEYSEAVADKKSAKERLRLYLWLAADFARRNPEWARTLYLEIWPSVLVSESAVRGSIDDYLRVIIYLIRQGEQTGEWPTQSNVYETSAILNGSVNQLIITWLLYRRPRDIMKATASVVDRILQVLLEPGPAAPATSRKTTRAKASRPKAKLTAS